MNDELFSTTEQIVRFTDLLQSVHDEDLKEQLNIIMWHVTIFSLV
jgi:hypothetical protein